MTIDQATFVVSILLIGLFFISNSKGPHAPA